MDKILKQLKSDKEQTAAQQSLLLLKNQMNAGIDKIKVKNLISLVMIIIAIMLHQLKLKRKYSLFSMTVLIRNHILYV
jgi:hypothetical protein